MKNILITGGTDGQGKATAHQLAKMGARLLLVGRNRARGEAAVVEITNASGNQASSARAAAAKVAMPALMGRSA